MKQYEKCEKCRFFEEGMFKDMGASIDGCKLLLYHKDYGLYGCLFNGEEKPDVKCKFYQNKKNNKALYKSILKEDFKDVDVW